MVASSERCAVLILGQTSLEVKPMANSMLMVTSRCTDPAREAEFNTWYDHTHLPDILSTPHFVAAQRYKLAGPPMKSEPDVRYLAIYEIDTEDTREAMKALGESLGKLPPERRLIDCIEVFSSATFTEIGKRQTAAAPV
jgi:hypothetical protein